jgi:hypothetical protein
MQATTAGKRGKVFMTTGIRNWYSKIAAYLLLITFSMSCSRDLSDDAIPVVPFSDIELRLTSPENVALRTDGGVRMLPTSMGGVQGIIVYRIDSHTFRAYERNCSYHPNDACVTVNVDPSNLFMIDPCCNSTFNFTEGEPIGGPAWRPLRRYETIVSGDYVTITDTIVE